MKMVETWVASQEAPELKVAGPTFKFAQGSTNLIEEVFLSGISPQ